MTRTALIAPIPHLEEFATNTNIDDSTHLVLAHLLSESYEYFTHYQAQADTGYIIVDNSSHELGISSVNAGDLLNLAKGLGAAEIVLPDVLFDAEATIKQTSNALHELKSVDLGRVRFMLVPQGQNPKEWADCLYKLVRLHLELYPGQTYAIGIAHKLCSWHGNVRHLMYKYMQPIRNWRENTLFYVHLLGWQRDYWRLGETIRKAAWEIRSTDSAKPFVYALNNIKLNGMPMEYPTRPEDYFYRTLNEEQLEIARWNVRVFKDLSLGRKFPTERYDRMNHRVYITNG